MSVASVGEIPEKETDQAEFDLHTLGLVFDLGEVDFRGSRLDLLPNIRRQFLAETEECGSDICLSKLGGNCNFFIHCIEKLSFEFVIKGKNINFAMQPMIGLSNRSYFKVVARHYVPGFLISSIKYDPSD